MEKSAHLYFHSPCFDGIVSCVLAWDFLEASQGWSIEDIHSVNYDMRPTWLSSKLHRPSGVVDFLYHPQAQFWADHHVTTFLTDEAKKDFERRKSPWLICDKRMGSCALLLWNHLASAFGYRSQHYEELVGWADKIDAAQYASVDEAVFGRQPALQINLSLGVKDGTTYCNDLVKLLRNLTLDQVAELPEVRARSELAGSLINAGLERFAKESRLEQDGIAVFDVDSDDVIVSRYAPYYFFPQARYSAGIVRSAKGTAITAMRNPWLDFPSLPLGEILSKFGGGGHQRVASIVLTGQDEEEANLILAKVVREIRKQEVRGHDTESEFL